MRKRIIAERIVAALLIERGGAWLERYVLAFEIAGNVDQVARRDDVFDAAPRAGGIGRRLPDAGESRLAVSRARRTGVQIGAPVRPAGCPRVAVIEPLCR